MEWCILDDDINQQIEEAGYFKPFKIKYNDKKICVVKTEDGVYGINNKCPHAGAKLHKSTCNKRAIISCHLHGYKFDMKTGKSVDENNYKIPKYSFKIIDGKYFIKKD